VVIFKGNAKCTESTSSELTEAPLEKWMKENSAACNCYMCGVLQYYMNIFIIPDCFTCPHKVIQHSKHLFNGRNQEMELFSGTKILPNLGGFSGTKEVEISNWIETKGLEVLISMRLFHCKVMKTLKIGQWRVYGTLILVAFQAMKSYHDFGQVLVKWP